MIIVVLSMTALIGMMALAIDGGFAYALHARMQTAADAAALAGAREMAMGNSKSIAISRATQILSANGGDPTRSRFEISDGEQINVTAGIIFDTFFAGILGLEQMNISARSAAAWGGVVATGNVLPLAVLESQWQPGAEVKLRDGGEKDDKKDDRPSPGNWGWITWGGKGGGTRELRDNVCYPPDALIPVGQWVDGEPGNKVPGLRAVEDCWLGETVTVLLYDLTNERPGNNLAYRVSGFAQFRILQINDNGSDKYILGEFIDFVQLGGVINPKSKLGNMGVALVAPTGGTEDNTNTPTPEPTATKKSGSDDDDDDHDKKTPKPTATKKSGSDDDDDDHDEKTPEPTATNTPKPTPTPECDKDNRDGNKCEKEK